MAFEFLDRIENEGHNLIGGWIMKGVMFAAVMFGGAAIFRYFRQSDTATPAPSPEPAAPARPTSDGQNFSPSPSPSSAPTASFRGR